MDDSIDHQTVVALNVSRPYFALAARQACIGMPPIPGYTEFDNLDLLLDPPCAGWLRCTLKTRHITCGLLEADSEVWDETGNFAAISRQIAQFRIQ